jgi:hypothetical protein
MFTEIDHSKMAKVELRNDLKTAKKIEPQMNTDKHRWKSKDLRILSVFICVHLWLKMLALLPIEWVISRG